MSELQTMTITHRVDREVLNNTDEETLINLMTAVSKTKIRRAVRERKAASK